MNLEPIQKFQYDDFYSASRQRLNEKISTKIIYQIEDNVPDPVHFDLQHMFILLRDKIFSLWS